MVTRYYVIFIAFTHSVYVCVCVCVCARVVFMIVLFDVYNEMQIGVKKQ
jgi:hypothetical protein